MDFFLDRLRELVGWSPCRARYLRRLFNEASHRAGDAYIPWSLQMSGLAGEVIEVDECKDEFRSVPEALQRARPWSTIRIVTDFDGLNQPQWIISKPVRIEHDGKNHHLFFAEDTSICFVRGCGRASLHGFDIHGSSSCPAIRCLSGQPWIEGCRIWSPIGISASRSQSSPYINRCSFHCDFNRDIGRYAGGGEAESEESSEGEESGNEPQVTMERIIHLDPPATLNPVGARLQAEDLWAMWVRDRNDYSSLRSQASSGPGFDQAMISCFDHDTVHLLRTSRNPKELDDALQRGRKTEEVRAALEYCGCATRLPSGAHMFVHPDLYAATKNAVAKMHLRPYHIIVSASLKFLVMEVINELPSRANVRVSSEVDIAYVRAGQFHILKNTFVDDAPVQRRPESVSHSTSRIHRAPNPRLALQNMIDSSIGSDQSHASDIDL
eukprot:TRINITY_DN43396_c0_g1_i1.p1 TRINITY_DN43396_c0_g1~~TRINITY_DN43396_c0_g1_i1.p1  ORF type:complete len:450 (-),score=43.15 TRINITY_DN43396_c0_g1_i1:431-1747(-)